MPEATKKPEGILENIITYLCFKSPVVSTIKLMKMVYLADVYNYLIYGKPLTDLTYTYYKHGVFNPLLYSALEGLYGKGIIKEKRVETKKGYVAVIPMPNVSETTVHIPDEAMEVLKQVIEDWGDAMPDEVVKYTKRTLPFLNTGEGERVDLSRSDPISCYSEEFHVSKETAATLDVLSDEDFTKKILKADKEVRSGKLLTHSEVFG
jgi:uncharacterized phage-associated protein